MVLQERGFWIACWLAATLVAPPVAAGSLYAWRSEDGVYAYTNDANAVPTRYRDVVKVSEAKGLAGFERLTVQDSSRSAKNSKRLQDRLLALREANRQAAAKHSGALTASQSGNAVVSLGSAGPGQPRVELSAADPATHEPLVIEALMTRRPGDLQTRRSTVIRQGERTLVVMKGERHHRSPTADVFDERDL